jgi:hypothetical protein
MRSADNSSVASQSVLHSLGVVDVQRDDGFLSGATEVQRSRSPHEGKGDRRKRQSLAAQNNQQSPIKVKVDHDYRDQFQQIHVAMQKHSEGIAEAIRVGAAAANTATAATQTLAQLVGVLPSIVTSATMAAAQPPQTAMVQAGAATASAAPVVVSQSRGVTVIADEVVKAANRVLAATSASPSPSSPKQEGGLHQS